MRNLWNQPNKKSPRNASGRHHEDYNQRNNYNGDEDQRSRMVQRFEDDREYEGSRGPLYTSNEEQPNDETRWYGSQSAGWRGQDREADRHDSWRQNHQSDARGEHFGKGPRNYKKTDARILEDVNDALTQHGGLDASDIEVLVEDGIVTLTGDVSDRAAKRMAEDTVESVLGVIDVANQIKLKTSGNH